MRIMAFAIPGTYRLPHPLRQVHAQTHALEHRGRDYRHNTGLLGRPGGTRTPCFYGTIATISDPRMVVVRSDVTASRIPSSDVSLSETRARVHVNEPREGRDRTAEDQADQTSLSASPGPFVRPLELRSSDWRRASNVVREAPVREGGPQLPFFWITMLPPLRAVASSDVSVDPALLS